MDDPWSELGIVPTTDEKIIRRAYAARLKAIDADRDAAAFMCLRTAYESARDAARIPQFADCDEALAVDEESHTATIELRVDPEAMARDPSIPEQSVSPSVVLACVAADIGKPADDGIPYGALQGFDAEFQRLLAACDSGRARDLLNVALAKGVIPLGREPGHARSLLICAVADPALSPDDLDAYVRSFTSVANTGIESSQILENIKARAAALRWWSGIEDATREGAGWGSCRRLFARSLRVARAISKGHAKGLMPGDADALSGQIARLREYGKWLPCRADADTLDQELRGIRQRDRWRTAAMIALIVSPAVIVRLPLGEDKGGMLALMAFCGGGFGLAFLTGWKRDSLADKLFAPVRWTLGLVCLAILILMSWLFVTAY
jgi:hypothetical protein